MPFSSAMMVDWVQSHQPLPEPYGYFGQLLRRNARLLPTALPSPI